jgi:hypothetical protein
MRCFRSWGIFYWPTNVAGWLLTALPAAFCIQVFLAIDRRSHSATDTLYGVFPFWVPTFLLWTWLAGRLSEPAPSPLK